MHTDDTMLVAVCEALSTLQSNIMADLSEFSKWFLHNQLTVKTDKVRHNFSFSNKTPQYDGFNLTNDKSLNSKHLFYWTLWNSLLSTHTRDGTKYKKSGKSALGCYTQIQAFQHFLLNILCCLCFSSAHCNISYSSEIWWVTHANYLNLLPHYKTRIKDNDIFSIFSIWSSVHTYEIPLFAQQHTNAELAPPIGLLTSF